MFHFYQPTTEAPKKKLTTKQAEMLEYIIRYADQHLYQPSLQEVADKFGVTRAAAALRLKTLCSRGWGYRVGDRAIEFAPETIMLVLDPKEARR